MAEYDVCIIIILVNMVSLLALSSLLQSKARLTFKCFHTWRELSHQKIGFQTLFLNAVGLDDGVGDAGDDVDEDGDDND